MDTHPPCSKNVWTHSLLCRSHTFTVLSSLPDTISRPSGENLTQLSLHSRSAPQWTTLSSGKLLNYSFKPKPTFKPSRHNRFMAPFPGPSGWADASRELWTLWCKGKLAEADTSTMRLDATPSGLTSAHLHYPPILFTGRMPFLPPNQQRQSTEGSLVSNQINKQRNVTLDNSFICTLHCTETRPMKKENKMSLEQEG